MKCFMVLVLILALGCAEQDKLPTSGRNQNDPYRVTEDFEATETDSGRRVWLLQAREARTYENPARTLMDSLTVFFYEDDGSLRSTLWSDSGRVQEDQGILIAQGNVRLVSTEGDTLNTEFLRYQRAQDEVSGPGPVRLAQAGRVLTGTGFRSTPDLSDYEVLENVKVVSREAPSELRDEASP